MNNFIVRFSFKYLRKCEAEPPSGGISIPTVSREVGCEDIAIVTGIGSVSGKGLPADGVVWGGCRVASSMEGPAHHLTRIISSVRLLEELTDYVHCTSVKVFFYVFLKLPCSFGSCYHLCHESRRS